MNASFEERLAAVEQAIAELKRASENPSVSSSWLDRFRGAFKNQPAFRDAVELGRAWRESDRPPEEADL